MTENQKLSALAEQLLREGYVDNEVDARLAARDVLVAQAELAAPSGAAGVASADGGRVGPVDPVDTGTEG